MLSDSPPPDLPKVWAQPEAAVPAVVLVLRRRPQHWLGGDPTSDWQSAHTCTRSHAAAGRGTSGHGTATPASFPDNVGKTSSDRRSDPRLRSVRCWTRSWRHCLFLISYLVVVYQHYGSRLRTSAYTGHGEHLHVSNNHHNSITYYYYYEKKRFRWCNVKRLQGHLTNTKDSDKTRVRSKVRTEYLSDAIVGRAVEVRKLLMNSSVFNWRLKDVSEDNDVRDLDRLFHVHAASQWL